MYRMRRARDHILSNDLTGEPAWDMLLALYSEDPAQMTVSSVCYGSGVPQSTALRWIALLEEKGLVARVEHPRDNKMVLLSLTEKGGMLVADALKTMLRAFRP
jgi:DNA-binding MarR family transcriptional regulator